MEYYTDGACHGNPGVGGWGALLIDESGNVIWRDSAGYVSTTNNRMELRAAISAVAHAIAQNQSHMVLNTDSQYVLKSMTEWGHKWSANGWFKNKARTQAVMNADLMQTLWSLCKQIKVNWKWVKGHSGVHGNELADQLANAAIARGDLLDDTPEPTLATTAPTAPVTRKRDDLQMGLF